MFNFSGSELVFLLLLALVVLGPEKLPDAVRRFGKTYAELKKMSTGFQSELRSALDEPMREMRETADALRKAVDVDVVRDAASGRSAADRAPAATPATGSAPDQPAAGVAPVAAPGGEGAGDAAAAPAGGPADDPADHDSPAAAPADDPPRIPPARPRHSTLTVGRRAPRTPIHPDVTTPAGTADAGPPGNVDGASGTGDGAGDAGVTGEAATG